MGTLICGCAAPTEGCENHCVRWKDKTNKPTEVWTIAAWPWPDENRELLISKEENYDKT